MAVRRHYNPNLATPETLEAMRFWVQNEIQAIGNGMQAGFEGLASESLAFFTAAGYGGIKQTSAVGISDIDAAFQTLPADADTLIKARGVTTDLANDALIFNVPGVWQVTLSTTLEFVDINAGRTFDARLFNDTLGSPALSTTLFVGRNQAGVNFSSSLLLDVPVSVVGDSLVVQIGNASTDFTGVTMHDYRFDTVHVSELESFET